jgi:hypothetical protein
LTKSFRGIVVQEDVSVLEVNREDAALRVSNTEICVALEGGVYLNNRSFPRPVMAHIKSLDLNQGILVLSGFVYAGNEWVKRRHERVQPKLLTVVALHWKGVTVRSIVRDISVDGMGVSAYKLVESGMRVRSGSTVWLDFELPPGHKFMALKGTITNINPMSNYSTAIGMRLFPKGEEARFLGQYVALRKQQIFEELDQAYWEMRSPRGVESLFF